MNGGKGKRNTEQAKSLSPHFPLYCCEGQGRDVHRLWLRGTQVLKGRDSGKGRGRAEGLGTWRDSRKDQGSFLIASAHWML